MKRHFPEHLEQGLSVYLQCEGFVLIARLDRNGASPSCAHAHPDKTLLDAVTGDVVIHTENRKQSQLAIKHVSPPPGHDDMELRFQSVRACLAHMMARREQAAVNVLFVIQQASPTDLETG